MKKQPILSVIVLVVCLALVGLGWVQARPQSPAVHLNGTCPPVQNTPFFTIVYGTVSINGTAAPFGTVVEARSPRGDTVGCFVVSEAGNYGSMYVYGEDTTVTPAIPGMRNGEEVLFYVAGMPADANPVLLWANDKEMHQVALSAEISTVTLTPTDTPTATPTDTPTATSTPSAFPDLVVHDMRIAPEFPIPDQSIVITVTLQNQGDTAVETLFYTDIYADHQPTGCDDTQGYYQRLDSLAIGEVITLSFTYPGFDTVGFHNLYAQVDSGCSIDESDETNNIYGPLRVQVQGEVPPPVADFSAAPTSGTAPLTVQFTDLSTGEINAWSWAFGDGLTGTAQSPTHTYTLTGTFAVSLTVNGPGGSDAETKAEYIIVSEELNIYLPLVLREHS